MTNSDRSGGTGILLPLLPEAEALTLRLTRRDLGFAPERIWNPSPSMGHRTEPWPVPKNLAIGIRGNADTAAKFSPPPFAVGLAGEGSQTLVQVAAEAGWHLWNEVVFEADASGLTVRVDLEGHSEPEQVAQHVRVVLVPGRKGEPFLELLARGLSRFYPEAYQAPASPAPDWWLRPIYCGWGDQVTASMWLEGVGPEPRATAYAIQGLYERWIRRLEQAEVPFGTVIIDAGWSPAGSLRPDLDQWPDLRGFIRRQHDAGRRVLLWLGTWMWDGLPDEWCVFADSAKLTADPTHPEYRRHLRERVHELISAEGIDADGFKIDQLGYSPSERHPWGGAQFGRNRPHPVPKAPIRLSGPGWGCELLHRLQGDIYAAAKTAKPDCLITSSTVHPYFHDTFDMVRLHDMGVVAADIFDAMGARARLSHAALPHKPIDTDDWVHSDYDLWLRYTSGSRRLGVPCIFYAERFMLNWQSEPATREIPLADLRHIAQVWRTS